ncbi:amino acid/amide ABC transporter ATP-binding protein 1, HAAT family [Halovenus aranensis]|jgi:branched-chain amino acid transport system ATP-binding protein|uniref:Probable branched-chain amino acid transport ATP-binding protein LivG n=1 Tax=Halovenus aranensis TaxID=890420 RepID=A0A1G8RWA0_9EURY|nr:ABC transporter ATP-binding protein [Halovenus aranensis]SDJ21212.1 amino acid/amide ABC transporter ATP-binding protein 1, HAAT family [Halovenus aranensis]
MSGQSVSQSSAGIRGGPQFPPEEAVLGCRNVTKTFGAITAVDDVSLAIDEGEWVSIVGPNGAGKTTLLNVLNGFYDPDTGGEIFLNGENVTSDPSYKRARKGLGRTFQGLELFEEEDVLENVMTVRAVKERPNLLSALLFYVAGGRKVEVENMRRVEEILDYLELWEYRHSTIGSLPLGIQRRVDLARSLALEPDVLLLDEAMSGLTFDEKYDMVRFLADLHEKEGMTMVMIEHDLEVVTDVSERMVVLDQGAIIARGRPEAVVDDPEVQRIYTGVE